jgi:hypothetical protein
MDTFKGAKWFKSSRSGGSGGNCVEVAFVGDTIAVRDSKDPGGPALVLTEAEWEAFIAGVKTSEFDRR